MVFKKGNKFGKGHKAWNKGLTKETDERIKKISDSLKGRKVWNKGVTHSEATRKKLSESHKGKHYSTRTEFKKGQHPSSRTEFKKGQHHSRRTEFKKGDPRLMGNNNPMKNPEVRKKVNSVENVKKRIRACCKAPNKLEKKMIDLINKNNLSYKFVGYGKFFIERRCPDFVNTNGQKKVIEVFGDYWHTTRARSVYDTEEGRIKLFSKYGFKTLVIWESEIRTDISKVLSKVINFDNQKQKLGGIENARMEKRMESF